MSKQRRFNKRKDVLKGLAIAVVTSGTVPLTSASESTHLPANANASPVVKSIKSVNSKVEKTSTQVFGTDFNAGKSANNGKKKEKPRSIRLNLKS